METLAEQAALARDAGQKAAAELQESLAELAVMRDREREQTQSLNALRAKWQEALGSQVSTEALQQAALGKVSGKVTQWLKAKSLDQQPRAAQQLRVDRGWERAVETVLGSYLEAVCVDRLDDVADLLGSFDGGHLAVVSLGELSESAGEQTGNAVPDAASLQAKVKGAAVLGSVLSSVFVAETLGEALGRRRRLGAGQSVVTRDGIWLGPDWLRLSRDQDPHAGVIEREESLRDIRVQVAGLADEVKESEQRLETSRERVREHEDRRERLQTDVNRLHREHVDRRAALEAAQARTADATRRSSAIETALADVRAELERTQAELREARGRMEIAIEALAALEPQRMELERERERLRTRAGRRADRRAGGAASGARSGLAGGVAPLVARLAHHHAGARREAARGAGAAPRRTWPRSSPTARRRSAALHEQIEAALQVRAQIEIELQAAKIASDELDALLRDRETHHGEHRGARRGGPRRHGRCAPGGPASTRTA